MTLETTERPSDEAWQLRQSLHEDTNWRHVETLFAQANGYIGTRGTLEEGDLIGTTGCEGVYLNGVFSQSPIPYGESAYGFATHNQKLLQVPNPKAIWLDNMQAVSDHSRSLDFRNGVLTRQFTVQLGGGGRVQVCIERLVSVAHPQLMALQYTVTSVDYDGPVSLLTALDARYAESGVDANDPRAGDLSIQQALHPVACDIDASASSITLTHQVKGTDFWVRSQCLDSCSVSTQVAADQQTEQRPGLGYQWHMVAGQTIRWTRKVVYTHSRDPEALDTQHVARVDAVRSLSWDNLMAQQQQAFDDFWRNATLSIEGDEATQQGLRFSQFHLFQSVGRDGHSAIAAKGLTGPGYDGHYFWDTEVYIIPFFALTQPDIARQLLMYRYNTLDAARQRARQMSHDSGALYAWRTIGGQECSAYYPASTAQYHINAAVAHAIKTYWHSTGDWQFVVDYGAEMLVETARLWLQLGHFTDTGDFCIDGVTGPDEYTAVVNNNFYTNFMAQQHLRFAIEVCEQLLKSNPSSLNDLKARVGLTEDELMAWQKIADAMYLPYDQQRQIHPQDDTFLNKARWDLANHPAEKRPLLLHYHPLVIYRHQVIKQADVVLAMYLGDDAFSQAQKARNLAYYEPLTTHDSTLSSCIHSIEYCETGQSEAAYRYFVDSARMDLDNLHHNTEYGIHTACMAGSWSCVAFGFLGMRVRADGLHLAPNIPSSWGNVSLNCCVRQTRINISANSTNRVTLTWLEGPQAEVFCAGKQLHISAQQPSVTVEVVA
ncbi:glycoside hydrolase family 65 protein [Aestuariibacter halophilus]|uniref:Glycoside hydrolase family 65 protein n=1 Tax=Fluctibacter halophilus TaxID=226011 RepID=A0ABS8GBT6_9ALTE|nr:glycosyl hydrolase family 65 protein [Aestuariibacter halophilus]MCC2618035.1 glycoside hydrolase family 65 protein [Aestuariibacter halophilus]